MSWAVLGFYIAIGITIFFIAAGIAGAWRGDKAEALLMSFIALSAFLVVCLFGHLGGMPFYGST